MNNREKHLKFAQKFLIQHYAKMYGAEFVAEQIGTENIKQEAEKYVKKFEAFEERCKQAKKYEKNLKLDEVEITEQDNLDEITQQVECCEETLDYYKSFVAEIEKAQQTVVEVFEEAKNHILAKLLDKAEDIYPLRRIACDWDSLPKHSNKTVADYSQNEEISKASIAQVFDTLSEEIVNAYEEDKFSDQDIKETEEARKTLAVLKPKQEKMMRENNIKEAMQMF